MKTVLEVSKLCKEYPGFCLKDVSFSVEAGSITGFIGRNGAGKTTTIKSIMNLIHPSGGNISCFGLPMQGNEDAIKQQLGYATGGIHYYARKKIREILAVTGMFYESWDQAACRHYLDYFHLDENKRLQDLSEGMKVKFNLTVALSHHAKLLILDEPTSGLDPVSREELLEVFLEIAQKGVAILFSTHITSDLQKCADHIVYIQKGQILAAQEIHTFQNSYRLLSLTQDEKDGLSPAQASAVLGICRNKEGFTALIPAESAAFFSVWETTLPDLETIMIHLDKEAL